MSSMLVWIVFAALTCAVLVPVLWPLLRAGRAPAAGAAAHDLAVYRDQLAEIDRDAELGTIAPADAEAARNEVKRRMLAAGRRGTGDVAHDGERSQRPAAVAAVLAVPAIAVGLYLIIGNPGMPSVPLDARLAGAVKNQDLPAMLAQVERHLKDNPDDVNGWMVLAPNYRKTGRYDEAAEAIVNVLRISGPDAGLFAELAETLTLGGNGDVSDRARAALVQALKLDPSLPKANFYMALADRQAGKTQAAAARWQAMLAAAPADAPWRAAVERQLADIAQPVPQAPGPTAEQVTQAQSMTDADRQAMIAGMVERLAEKLAADGSDLDGWLRLARARMVLGQRDEAMRALDRAEAQFSADPDAMNKIGEARAALGLPRGKS